MELDPPQGVAQEQEEVSVEEEQVGVEWEVTALGLGPAVAVSALIVGLRYPIR